MCKHINKVNSPPAARNAPLLLPTFTGSQDSGRTSGRGHRATESRIGRVQ
jgi:hypothetical protein